MTGVRVNLQNDCYVIQSNSETEHARLREALHVFCDVESWQEDKQHEKFTLTTDAYSALYSALKSDVTTTNTPRKNTCTAVTQTTCTTTECRGTQTENLFTIPKVVVLKSNAAPSPGPVVTDGTPHHFAVPQQPRPPLNLKQQTTTPLPRAAPVQTAASTTSQGRSVIMSVPSTRNDGDDAAISEVSGMSDWEAYDAKRRRVEANSSSRPIATNQSVPAVRQNALLQNNRPFGV
jgi:hypothetical protein